MMTQLTSRSRLTLAVVLAAASACSRSEPRGGDTSGGAAPPAAAAPDSAPTSRWAMTPRGLGALQAGMTLAEASAALDGALEVRAGADTAGCDFVRWRGAPTGVKVMVEGGRIARVDVDSGTLATAEGARVGDGEERVKALYPGRVTVTPHKYTDGRYLTVTPAAPADSGYRIVFETDSAGRVTRYRAGRPPAVEYVEGCS